jgi:hypothetical protein
MGWAFIFEFYSERKRGVKSKNIKVLPMCKFAQLYACYELFLKYNTFTVILQVQGFIEIWKKEKKARSVSNFKLL